MPLGTEDVSGLTFVMVGFAGGLMNCPGRADRKKVRPHAPGELIETKLCPLQAATVRATMRVDPAATAVSVPRQFRRVARTGQCVACNFGTTVGQVLGRMK